MNRLLRDSLIAFIIGIVVLVALLATGANSEPQAPPEIEAAANYAADEWGIDRDAMLRVAWCESRYNPDAETRHHLGLWQHSRSKWPRRVEEFNRQARAQGLPTMTGVWRAPIDNARITARMVKGDGSWRQWSCQP